MLGDTTVRNSLTKQMLTRAAFFFAMSGSTLATEVAPPAVTVAEYAVRLLTEGVAGNVEKCVAEVPSMKRDLDLAMSQRRSRIRVIANSLFSDPRFESAVRESVSPDYVAFNRSADRVPVFVGTDPKQRALGRPT